MSIDVKEVPQDFYEAVNGKWIETAVIPGDKSATGGFNDLVDDIEKLLMKDFALLDEKNVDDPRQKEFLKFYQLAKDFSRRETEGVAPLQPYLDRVENLKNLADLNQALPDFFFGDLPTPFQLGVQPDMKNAEINALYVAAPGLILPDKTSYAEENPNRDQLLAIYRQMVVAMFEKLGRTTEEAEKLAQGTLEFDSSLVPFVKSHEESAEYAKSYNPQDFKTFVANSKNIDLAQLLPALIGEEIDTVIVEEPIFFAHLDELVNEENFSNLKSWLTVRTAISLAGLTTEEFRQLAGTYSRALSGKKEASSPEKSAYYLATSLFDQVVGDYYGHKYFGEAAKADVLSMVKKMIGVYQKRLSENTWLSENTREKAVEKLNAITIKVGFPDEVPAVFDKLVVSKSSLLDNTQAFTKVFIAKNLAEWHQPVDKSRWGMSANVVNAYYSPSQNEIVFPAAILQAPFYSIKQSSAANYGGIGAVIAHEISHAFDNNGAQFDEHGNLNNWWTEKDLAHFKTLAEKMVAAFEGQETPAGKVNGRLTVSENIADAGGLSCALEALKEEEKPALDDFFVNWATIWRTKSTLAYQQMLLSFDVHGPAKLRANLQVKNLKEFYTTFNITKNDAMYLAPEKRIAIW